MLLYYIILHDPLLLKIRNYHGYMQSLFLAGLNSSLVLFWNLSLKFCSQHVLSLPLLAYYEMIFLSIRLKYFNFLDFIVFITHGFLFIFFLNVYVCNPLSTQENATGTPCLKCLFWTSAFFSAQASFRTTG